MLNNGFIILLNTFPNKFGRLVFDNSSVAMKKGRSDGTIEFAHSFKPDFAAMILLDENINKHIINIINIVGIIFLFILATI